MSYLIADFETSSEVEIKEEGLYNYATHHSTRALMLGWAIVSSLSDKKPEVKLWQPHLDIMPTELKQALRDEDVAIIAHNSAFERYILLYVLGIDISYKRFQDTQPSARYLSLPGHLDDVGTILGLPHELRKDKAGEALIQLFSVPHTRKKKEGGGIYFNNWSSHPVEWKKFGEYCMQDVRAELEVARRLNLLRVFPLPERERRIWEFDQVVNDRGMPTDRMFVEKAFALASRSKEEKKESQNQLTGLENANSPAQLLPWVRERGYPLNNLRKNNIELVLKNKVEEAENLTDECRAVMEARMEAGSTSYTKLEAILRNINPDGRLRGQFIYRGSPRCGRWSGNAVQLHNMARPDGTFEDMDNVVKARDYIFASDYAGLCAAFQKDKPRPAEDPNYSPLIIAKNVIRTVFIAPPGKRLNVCDLNAIETRVAAWIAECPGLLQVFADGQDPYLSFASKIWGIPYDKLLYDLKKNPDKVAKALAKLRRQLAKPGVLGAVYRLSAGGWGYDPKTGDRIKTGFWGYAEKMGVDMELPMAVEIVKVFRESYPEICGNGYKGQMKGIWVRLEEAVMEVMQGERTVRSIGPDGGITIDKLTVEDRNPILRIKLPSGNYLHYLDASIMTVRMPWNRTNPETGAIEEVHRPAFTYYGQNQETKQWDLIISHGGKLFENVVQAIAREVLADKLLEFEAIGLETVGHVHDEGICLSDDTLTAPGVKQMVEIMNTPVIWAPTLPLGSDGFQDYFYHK